MNEDVSPIQNAGFSMVFHGYCMLVYQRVALEKWMLGIRSFPFWDAKFFQGLTFAVRFSGFFKLAPSRVPTAFSWLEGQRLHPMYQGIGPNSRRSHYQTFLE